MNTLFKKFKISERNVQRAIGGSWSTRRVKDTPVRSRIHSRGFTILETLVAIAILIIAITGPLAIVAQSLRSSYFSRDQITAYYLAQEAIEYVRNTRDTFGLDQTSHSGEDWISTLVDEFDGPVSINVPGSQQARYYLERSTAGYVLKSCTTGSECVAVSLNRPLLDNPGSADEALYGEDSATEDSIFIREIIFNEPTLGSGETYTSPTLRELDVTVKVKWRMQDGSYSSGIVLKEYLTNWQLPNTGA